MWKDSRTDGAGPHAQGGGDVGRLRMSGQMFAQAALVDVVFAAHWTGVRRCSALDGAGRRSRNGPSATYAARQTAQAVDHVRRDAQAAQRRRQAAATANLLLLVRVRLLLMLLRRQQRRHRRRLLLLVDVMGQRRKQTVLMGHQHRRAGRTFASRRRSFAYLPLSNEIISIGIQLESNVVSLSLIWSLDALISEQAVNLPTDCTSNGKTKAQSAVNLTLK